MTEVKSKFYKLRNALNEGAEKDKGFRTSPLKGEAKLGDWSRFTVSPGGLSPGSDSIGIQPRTILTEFQIAGRWKVLILLIGSENEAKKRRRDLL